MAKKEKHILFLNETVLEEFKNKFHYDLPMNFFSYKNVIVSKSCFTKNLAQLLGNLNGIIVNEWKEEKSVFDVLIISAIDIEEMKRGNFFKDVHECIANINKRQKIIDDKKLSADIYIIDEKTFLAFYENRSGYIEKNKIDNFDKEKLHRAMIIPPIPVVGQNHLFE